MIDKNKKVKTKMEKDKNTYLLKQFFKIAFETDAEKKLKNIDLVLKSLIEEAKKGNTKAIKMALELYEKSAKIEAFPRDEKNIKKLLKQMMKEKK